MGLGSRFFQGVVPSFLTKMAESLLQADITVKHFMKTTAKKLGPRALQLVKLKSQTDAQKPHHSHTSLVFGRVVPKH